MRLLGCVVGIAGLAGLLYFGCSAERSGTGYYNGLKVQARQGILGRTVTVTDTSTGDWVKGYDLPGVVFPDTTFTRQAHFPKDSVSSVHSYFSPDSLSNAFWSVMR